MRALIHIFYLALAAGATSTAFAQTPLLPVQSSTSKLPLLGEALRDPKIGRARVNDAVEAGGLIREIEEYKRDLAQARGQRRSGILKTLMNDYANLVAYYEDALNGKLDKEGNPASLSQLSKARWQLIKHANDYRKAKPSASEAARAAYHAHTQRFMVGNQPASAIASLEALKGLDGYLQRRADLLVALYRMDRGTQAAQMKSFRSLVSLIAPLPHDGAMVARLAAARKMAGLNSKGRKYKKADEIYRAYLYAATKKAGRFGKPTRDEILTYAVGIWRAAEGRSATWNKSPIYLAAFRDLPNFNGLREREAIQSWRDKQYSAAVRTYQSLSKTYDGTLTRAKLDNRIIDIRASEFRDTKKPHNYEVALIRALDDYKDATILGTGNEAKAEQTRQQIDLRYRKLIDRSLYLAKSKNAKRQTRLETIALTQRYIEHNPDSPKREFYQESIGDIYAVNNQHRRAVGIYMDLGLNGSPSVRAGALQKATTSQRSLANWPESAPWKGFSRGSSQERQKLQEIYQARLDLGKSASTWSLLAHVGLLKIVNGQGEEAFKKWEEALQSSQAHHHSNHAAGYMLNHYERTRNWLAAERLAKLTIQRDIRPLYRGQAISAVNILSLALLNGGKELLAKGEYAKARERLAEFTQKFSNHKQHDEGLYHLAHAYRGEGNHRQSIVTLVTLTKIHKTSRFFRDGARIGGNWSMSMALEEETIHFYRSFVERFPNDEHHQAISENLAMLYEGRELFGQASLVYINLAQSKKAGHKRAQYAQEALRIESHHGGPIRAMQAADLLLKYAQGDYDAAAAAYSYKAKFYGDEGRLDLLQKLESSVSRLPATNATQNALALTRLIIANHRANSQQDEIFNLELRDPLRTLNDEYARYIGTKQLFDAVCDAGTSGYCAPAMLKLANLAEATMTRLEDISIPDKFAKKIVDQFNQRKESILDTLANHEQSYVEKAGVEIAKGETDPDSTQQVLWENSSDWNFDRITGETGNGFIQFSPDLVVGE